MAYEAVETALVSSFYGAPADVTTPTQSVNGIEVALVKLSDAPLPYEGDKRSEKKCVADENTCEGWKAKGTPYCMGHLRAMAKDQKAARGE